MGCLGQLTATTRHCYVRMLDAPFPCISPANIEISITAAIIFWYRPGHYYCYDHPQREEIVLHWPSDVIIGAPGVLFWLRSSGDSGSLRGWHGAPWRWSRAGCWIISGGVCCVASSDASGEFSPPRDFDHIRHHFNVFIWWPMLQIKILSLISVKNFIHRVMTVLFKCSQGGGGWEENQCVLDVRVCVLRVSCECQPLSRHVTVRLLDNNNFPLITTK